MTIADFHAIALLACPVLAVFAIWRAPRPATGPRPGLLELVLPLLVAFAANLTQHGCDERAGFHQTLITLASMWAALFWIGPRFVRWAVAVVLAIAMVALAHHSHQLVHSDHLTGIPDRHATGIARITKDRSMLIAALGSIGETNRTSYGAGWLRDLPFAEQLPMLNATVAHYHKATPLWHSRFTGLYRRELRLFDYWYPGGALSEAAAALEVRSRPDAPVPSSELTPH